MRWKSINIKSRKYATGITAADTVNGDTKKDDAKYAALRNALSLQVVYRKKGSNSNSECLVLQKRLDKK